MVSDFQIDEKHQVTEPVTNGHEVNGHDVIDDGSETDSFIKSDRKLGARLIGICCLGVVFFMVLHLSIGNFRFVRMKLINRVNIGVARIAGMEIDINLTGNHYSVALSRFLPLLRSL